MGSAALTVRVSPRYLTVEITFAPPLRKSPLKPAIESVVNISVSPLLPSRCTYSSTVPVLEVKKGSGVCADAAACAMAAVERRIRNVFIAILS